MLSKHQQHGLSLVELMIGLTISAFLTITAVIAVSLISSNTRENSNTTKLDHELRSSIMLMIKDIRRAGYWASASNDLGTGANNNPFMQTGTTDIAINGSNNCISFSYDLDKNGTIPALNTSTGDERFAYRLSGGTLQSRVEAYTDLSCTASAAAWIDLTDSNIVNVTSLVFSLNTETINLSSGTLSRRTIDITLVGQLLNDSDITRTLQETVFLRNDYYAP